MPEIDIKVAKLVQTEARPVATYEYSATMEEMGKGMSAAFGKIMAHLGRLGMQPTGAPFAMYPKMQPNEGGQWDVIVGFPVASEIEDGEEVKSGYLPAVTAATATHWGPYEKLEETYNQVFAWIKENGYEQSGPMWELYYTDPKLELDASKWKTEIFVPVKKV